MFENKVINGIHATRYIMSWVREGGMLKCRDEGVDDFQKWLLSLGLAEDDAQYIVYLAMNGKLELETSANNYLKNMTEQ